MNYSEEAIRFTCSGDALLGIMARPDVPATSGFIVVVGGPQYRVGSHRQFVLLSRRLAAAGYAVLRFDYRGMGDSTGQLRSFDSVSDDIAAAIHALQTQVPSVQHITLWGLCDGASAALLYWHETADARVHALCLLNPWVRSEASLARTQVKHYYLQRLGQKDFWRKVLRGRVAWQALLGLTRNLRLALMDAQTPDKAPRSASAPNDPACPFQHCMAAGWNSFAGNIMLILSGDDYTAKEFLVRLNNDPAWKNALTHPGLMRHDLPGVDHTFSTAAARDRVEQLTLHLGQHLRLPAAPSWMGDVVRPDVQLGAPTQSQIRAPV
jgi:exosortase A-associated hydrolase 1